MFSEREAKLVGTSDFVVTKGYVQIRVVGFPMGVRLARGRSAAPGPRAAPPPRAGGSSPVGVPSMTRRCSVTDTRFERVTFVSDALPLRQSVEGNNEDAAAVRSPAA